MKTDNLWDLFDSTLEHSNYVGPHPSNLYMALTNKLKALPLKIWGSGSINADLNIRSTLGEDTRSLSAFVLQEYRLSPSIKELSKELKESAQLSNLVDPNSVQLNKDKHIILSSPFFNNLQPNHRGYLIDNSGRDKAIIKYGCII
tara:strand:+ start:1809 stop:2243 length:435 start_codon:yes stop_codon:yes gene_type:complete